MAYTHTWNAAYEAEPAAGDPVSGGDDAMRSIKLDVRERLSKDHYFEVAGTDADHGEHVKVTLRVGSAPAAVADKGMLYAKDVSSVAQLFYRDENGVEYQLTGIGGSGGSSKVAVPSGNFTATPASTSTLTMLADMTGSIYAGMPLEYVIGGTTYYGIVSAIASNLLTLAGPPFSGDVTALYYGGGTVRNILIHVSNTLSTETKVLANIHKSPLVWTYSPSYIVRQAFYVDDRASGVAAGIDITGTLLGTGSGFLGLLVNKTWYSSVVDIDPAAYAVTFGQSIEVEAVVTGDATNLTILITVVTP